MIANFLPSKIACPFCYVDGLSNQMSAQDNEPGGFPLIVVSDFPDDRPWFDGLLQPYTCDAHGDHTVYIPFMKPIDEENNKLEKTAE